MAHSEDFNISIISDLHLSEGRNPQTKQFNLNEDFFFDEEFDRFLAYLEAESGRRRKKWRLLIAGDMVDFLQITRKPRNRKFKLRKSEEDYGLGTSPEKTVWKMKVMMNGHWTFFKALGRFIAQGNRCTILTGNHDIEWTVPEIQNAFREEMKENYLPSGVSNGDEVVSSHIEFCPWFYYEPGLIWVEHGHQYDGMNSFDYFLYPYLPSSNELMLPGGSFFVRYLFNKIEQHDPFADNIKPLSAYLKKNLVKLIFSKDVLRHVWYFLKIVKKVKKFQNQELEILKEKNEEGMKREAGRFGIDIEKLRAIRKHWMKCFLYNLSKPENMIKFLFYKEGDTYQREASFIQKHLEVRYVVFGHTHEVDLLTFSSDQEAEYSNSGTWTRIFSINPGERLLHEEHESIFVQILKDEGNKLELLKWRDDLGLGERVKLFERDKSRSLFDC